MDLANLLIKIELALLGAMAIVLAFRIFAPPQWRHWLTQAVHRHSHYRHP